MPLGHPSQPIFSDRVPAGEVKVRRGAARTKLSSPLAGGALIAVGCYWVNGARLIAGEPARVTAEQQQGP